MHVYGIINTKALERNLDNLDYSELTEEEHICLKYMLENSYEKYNIRVISSISPDLFKKLVSGNFLLIYKYAKIFYDSSRCNNPNLEQFKIIYRVLLEIILEMEDKALLHYIFLKLSYDWIYDLIEPHIKPYFIYDKQLLVSVISSHNTQISQFLINRFMELFFGFSLEFNIKGIPMNLFNKDIFDKFRKTNKIIGCGK